MGKDCKVIDYQQKYEHLRDYVTSIRRNRIVRMQDLEHVTPHTDTEKEQNERWQIMTLVEVHLLDNILTEMDEIDYKARYIKQ